MINLKPIEDRGFLRGEFFDQYEQKCSIQESSLATEACIWFGINNPRVQIMARDTPEGGNGWREVPLPEKACIWSRMHLTQEMVAELIPALQHFVDNGYLPGSRSEENKS